MHQPPDPFAQSQASVQRQIADRQRLLRNEAEEYLREQVLDYETRQQEHWARDYSSVEAFDRSVEPNRRR